MAPFEVERHPEYCNTGAQQKCQPFDADVLELIPFILDAVEDEGYKVTLHPPLHLEHQHGSSQNCLPQLSKKGLLSGIG